jgi:hypothetical protein
MTAHSPDLVQEKSITLTHKYMTAHSPGLVQAAKSITLTHKYMTAHSWLGTGKINNPNTNTRPLTPDLVQAKSITLTQIHDRSLLACYRQQNQ